MFGIESQRKVVSSTWPERYSLNLVQSAKAIYEYLSGRGGPSGHNVVRVSEVSLSVGFMFCNIFYFLF